MGLIDWWLRAYTHRHPYLPLEGEGIDTSAATPVIC
jgi:hypothetical protein